MRHLHTYILFIVVLWLGLYLDGTLFVEYSSYGQWITNTLVLLTFGYLYTQANERVKKLMIYGVIIGFGGEILFSIVLGMYTYRLSTLPLYVPFGHSIVYVTVYYLSKEPFILRYQDIIIRWLYLSMIVYSLAWLIWGGDIFGFLCTLGILWAFQKRPDGRLFFLIMFFAIVYLELVGTHYGTWVWPPVWFDKFTWITSANPPSGISIFYFAFDMGCLWFYKRLHPDKWQRFKRVISYR